MADAIIPISAACPPKRSTVPIACISVSVNRVPTGRRGVSKSVARDDTAAADDDDQDA